MAGRGFFSVGVVALLLAGACGGGSDNLSKSEYIAAGDGLCQRFLDKSEAVMEDVETEEQLADAIDEIVEEGEQVDEEFSGLSAPDDAEDVQAELLDSLRKSTAKAREAADALKRNDESWESLLEEADRLGSESDAAAKEYGFKVCGSEHELSNS